MKFCIIDIETNSVELKEINRIHVLSYSYFNEEGVFSLFDYEQMKALLLDPTVIIVGHNFKLYDKPALEKILGIEIPLKKIIDTLALSWGLYPEKIIHGLSEWGSDLGIKKPEIEDWEGLTKEEYAHRCEEDVKINSKLFRKQLDDLNTLYDSNKKKIKQYIDYLNFKLDLFSLQSKNPFKLDMPLLEENLMKLTDILLEKQELLVASMPKVPNKVKRNPPKNPYKQDGTISATGIKWKNLTEEVGLSFDHNEPIEVIKDWGEPNPNSPQQIKDWLDSLGWIPANYKDGSSGPVPQIYTDDKDLCPSVLVLGDVVKPLDEYGVIKHRIGALKGFITNQEDGYIKQSIAGFTSTLRIKHKFLVNLPKPKARYGEYLRAVLSCDLEEYEICGSDLASLEDRCKQHYIYAYDPEYVKSMQVEGFDPHLDLAVFAGALTEDQAAKHKSEEEDHSDERSQYKAVNYGATYGMGAPKLALMLGIPESKSRGILDAYWERNWSVKVVAKTFRTKTCLGLVWVENPLNGFYYQLRSDKDRFSAVNQSTGAYIFDLWMYFVIPYIQSLTLQSHDEGAWVVKKGNREKFEEILRWGIAMVNYKLKLNRDMDIDIKWGDNYASVH